MANIHDGGSQGLTFLRQLNNWELEEVGILLGRLRGYFIALDIDDFMVWVDTKKSKFSVKWYSFLVSKNVVILS